MKRVALIGKICYCNHKLNAVSNFGEVMAKMQKIEVKVCLGTTCFVMGAPNMHELLEIIPEKYGDRVEVSGSLCLGLCYKNQEYSKAPYVMVGDEVVEEATVERVLESIERKLTQ